MDTGGLIWSIKNVDDGIAGDFDWDVHGDSNGTDSTVMFHGDCW